MEKQEKRAIESRKKERLQEFEKYPAYKNMYLQAFTRMLKHRKENGNEKGFRQKGQNESTLLI